MDSANPQSWDRYAYGCDPLDTTDNTGMANPCTIDVSVSSLGKHVSNLSAIESHVNQIFAATPAADGSITQVHFIPGGDTSVSLQFLNADLTPQSIVGNDTTRIVLGLWYPGGGWPALVFSGTIAGPELGWNYPAAQTPDLIGSVAAHELMHEITGLGDLTGANLLGFDKASDPWAAVNDYASPTPTGYSKLSTAEATDLHNNCISAKLKPPKYSGPAAGYAAAGGDLGVDPFEVNPWFWFVSFLNSNLPLPNCPHGDCK